MLASLSELLASEQRPGTGRHANRNRLPSPAALTRFQERAEEVLVLYPTDGYWRARPLAPQNLRATAYGSSFLVGPVEEQGRPLVDLKDVAFDPASRTFSLSFARGGSATLRLDTLDQERIDLEVTLEPPVGQDQPFAALRSMHVSETNSDVAHVAWRAQANPLWQDAQIMSFQRARAVSCGPGGGFPLAIIPVLRISRFAISAQTNVDGKPAYRRPSSAYASWSARHREFDGFDSRCWTDDSTASDGVELRPPWYDGDAGLLREPLLEREKLRRWKRGIDARRQPLGYQHHSHLTSTMVPVNVRLSVALCIVDPIHLQPARAGPRRQATAREVGDEGARRRKSIAKLA